MSNDSVHSDGRLPIGLSKDRDAVMPALEGWIEEGASVGTTHYEGCYREHWRCMMEKAHQEIALLRLRLLRLTVGGTHADPVTNGRDVVRVLDSHIANLKGKANPVDETILLEGLERAREELLRHRSLL
jgi:hypothetical protein